MFGDKLCDCDCISRDTERGHGVTMGMSDTEVIQKFESSCPLLLLAPTQTRGTEVVSSAPVSWDLLSCYNSSKSVKGDF